MSKNKNLLELNRKEFFFYNFRKRILFFFGWIFIYAIPILIIISKISIVKEVKNVNYVDLVFLVIGGVYLVFISKHIRNKITQMKDGAKKSFYGGITSLIPVIVLTIFVQVFQNIINSLPNIDIAKYLWVIITSIGIGLAMQVLDSVINKDYLYELEVYKTAKKEIDIEKKKEEIRSNK